MAWEGKAANTRLVTVISEQRWAVQEKHTTHTPETPHLLVEGDGWFVHLLPSDRGESCSGWWLISLSFWPYPSAGQNSCWWKCWDTDVQVQVPGAQDSSKAHRAVGKVLTVPLPYTPIYVYQIPCSVFIRLRNISFNIFHNWLIILP